jgi:hypothetical protein
MGSFSPKDKGYVDSIVVFIKAIAMLVVIVSMYIAYQKGYYYPLVKDSVLSKAQLTTLCLKTTACLGGRVKDFDGEKVNNNVPAVIEINVERKPPRNEPKYEETFRQTLSNAASPEQRKILKNAKFHFAYNRE